MAICRLIYSSRLATDPEGLIADVLSAANRNNKSLGLTGALLLDHQCFLQMLEGSRSAVSQMFLRISQDARHDDVCLIGVSEAPRRLFPDWSMHHASMLSGGPTSVKAFMPHSEFDGRFLSSESAIALFESVAHRAEAARELT